MFGEEILVMPCVKGVSQAVQHDAMIPGFFLTKRRHLSFKGFQSKNSAFPATKKMFLIVFQSSLASFLNICCSRLRFLLESASILPAEIQYSAAHGVQDIEV